MIALSLWLLGGCKEPRLEVIPGVTAAVEIVVGNPTDCATCDGFAAIDTLRLDVTRGDEVVATDSFAWPGDEVVLPDLSTFGVVRVALVGLSGGRVVSGGRTAEFAVPSADTLSIPLFFAPVNRALPLPSDMVTPRSRHNALRRRDGAIVLSGGLDARGTRALSSIEVYDPLTATFSELGTLPTASVADQVVAPLPDGESMLVGGMAVVGESQVAVEVASVFDGNTGTITAAGALNEGRYGHCVAMFRDRQGLVLGGGGVNADYLRRMETGEWGFDAVPMRDFDPSTTVGCAALTDGTVFVLGDAPTGTGIWAGGSDTADPAAAFTPITGGSAGDVRFVEGAAYLPTEEGAVYILGGADVETGAVKSDGRLFSPSTGRFTEVAGFRRPRYDADVVPWIQDGWYAAGCSWADVDRTEEEPALELIAPAIEGSSPLLSLDHERPGCALSVLNDGALLVTGGYPSDGSGADAALIVPWTEE